MIIRPGAAKPSYTTVHGCLRPNYLSFIIIFVLIVVFVIRAAEIASLNKIHGKLLLDM